MPDIENMGQDFSPADLGVNISFRAHHTVQRKPGVPTFGMTYLGLHDSAAAAEAARASHVKSSDFFGYAHSEIEEEIQEWLDSTEVVELAENEKYTPHGYPAMIHGINDGAHGSKKANPRELMDVSS